MEQVGHVVDIKEGKAIVMVKRHDVCGKCGGCGVAVSGSGDNYVEAVNAVNAAIGQNVRVAMKTSHVLKASFVVYIVPIIALLAGIWLGQTLERMFGVLARFDLILGFVFLIGSYLLVRGYDKKVAGGEAAASVVEILNDDFEGPKDERC